MVKVHLISPMPAKKSATSIVSCQYLLTLLWISTDIAAECSWPRTGLQLGGVFPLPTPTRLWITPLCTAVPAELQETQADLLDACWLRRLAHLLKKLLLRIILPLLDNAEDLIFQASSLGTSQQPTLTCREKFSKEGRERYPSLNRSINDLP